MTRTTLDIDPGVLSRMRVRAHSERKSMSRLVSELVEQALDDSRAIGRAGFFWESADMQPLVDLEDKEAVAAAMDELR